MKLLAALICLLIGGYLLFRAYVTHQKGQDSTDWLPVSARIITSDVVTRQRPTAKHQETTVYHPDVSYRYSVNGREFSSSLIQWGMSDKSSKEEAQSIVAQYPAGKETTAFYKPSEPTLAVLIRGKSPQNWNNWIFGTVFLVVGIGLIIKHFK